MAWIVHYTVAGSSAVNYHVSTTKDEALQLAKRMQQSNPNVSVSKISGPNGQVLPAEQLVALLKSLE